METDKQPIIDDLPSPSKKEKCEALFEEEWSRVSTFLLCFLSNFYFLSVFPSHFTKLISDLSERTRNHLVLVPDSTGEENRHSSDKGNLLFVS